MAENIETTYIKYHCGICGCDLVKELCFTKEIDYKVVEIEKTRLKQEHGDLHVDALKLREGRRIWNALKGVLE